MTIVEFFELSVGKWLSQRSSHRTDSQQTQGGKSELQFEMLSSDHPDIAALCAQHDIDPTLVGCSAKIAWTGTTDHSTKKITGVTMIVSVPDAAKASEGMVICQPTLPSSAPVVGRYAIGRDDVLTFTRETKTTFTEERLWFASPNLRLRTSLVSQGNGLMTTSFYSEIRFGGAKPTS
ncbi:MAG: phycobiliprotein lyase [Cyanobacteria bacterium]|nr:phycobiliprotein lyase [Cyanobacteriota bacterium]MDW8199972.1 phycobiliprotein lyase [Cyanobacteriota bacterium SKYGB_h_bin112]